MKLLQEKLVKYGAPQRAMAMGIYPYFREIQSDQDMEVLISRKKVLMFDSNAYLGLANHPRVKEAAIRVIKKYGTGCTGSRFLNGMLDLHLRLEKRLTEFVGKKDAIVYSISFQANLGVTSCIIGREDYILWGESDHTSIIGGHRLSFPTKLKFKHDGMDSLERQLQKHGPSKVKLVVIDDVFSMEGDVVKLPEIVALAKKYNASVMVNETHGIGVFGDHDRSTYNHFGITNDVDLIMGTFGKFLAPIGGFIASDKPIANYLRRHSRSCTFNTSSAPAATIAMNAALDIMLSEPERIQHLWDLTHYALDGFRNTGCEIGHTSTSIIPLFIRDNDSAFLTVEKLFEAGVFVNPVIAPVIASEDTLTRFSFMATHAKKQLDYALEAIYKVFGGYGLVD